MAGRQIHRRHRLWSREREVAQDESIFRLCYLCGPAGIIVALAEQIS